jgi:hypothetical protein
MTPTPQLSPSRKPRNDGWTPQRRRAFMALLRDGIDVRRASARVGMSRRSAYHVRTRDAAFAHEWNAALREARALAESRLIALLVERAPWARAAFPEAAREGGGVSSQDTVTSVTCV